MTDPQPSGLITAQPNAAVGSTAQQPEGVQPYGFAQPDDQAGEIIARIESATARLGSVEHSDGLPLTELAAELAALHGQLQSALSELDRT